MICAACSLEQNGRPLINGKPPQPGKIFFCPHCAEFLIVTPENTTSTYAGYVESFERWARDTYRAWLVQKALVKAITN